MGITDLLLPGRNGCFVMEQARSASGPGIIFTLPDDSSSTRTISAVLGSNTKHRGDLFARPRSG